MKILKSRIFFFLLGAIIFSGVMAVAVTTISADKITYTDKNNVETTVDKVLDDLYSNLDGKIGATYYSSSYGNQRLQTMSNLIQLPTAGKYLCTTIHTQASGNSSATAVNNESYFLVGLDITSFECDIDNSSTIQASVSSNVSSVVPWIMYTTCSEIK